MNDQKKTNIVEDIVEAVDWKMLFERSAVLRKWAQTPAAIRLFLDAKDMRDSLAQVMHSLGLITASEARPSKEGGLGIFPLLMRATNTDTKEEQQ